MNFATASITVENKTSGSKYMAPGINEDCAIMEITSGASSVKGTPFIAVTFSKGDESSFDAPFYMSDAAQEKSQQKLIHILVDGLGVDRAAVDAAGAAAVSLDDYAAKLNKLVPRNNSVRLKIKGEQYSKTDGNIGTKKAIGFVPFVEPMATKPSKLRYDDTSKYDFERLPTPDGTMPGAAKKDDNDLPF